jgi:hypothetical protein
MLRIDSEAFVRFRTVESMEGGRWPRADLLPTGFPFGSVQVWTQRFFIQNYHILLVTAAAITMHTHNPTISKHSSYNVSRRL